jgi:hypothetical protein
LRDSEEKQSGGVQQPEAVSCDVRYHRNVQSSVRGAATFICSYVPVGFLFVSLFPAIQSQSS